MNYKSLRNDYGFFRYPLIEIQINEVSLTAGTDRKYNIGVSDVTVDLTAGYEASQAVFNLYSVYDYQKAMFYTERIKGFILLGSPVRIMMGYKARVTEVFCGVITKVTFRVEEGDMAAVQVTAMDMKAVMMANRYNKKLKAMYYSDAVKEILDQKIYQSMQDTDAIKEFKIYDTPDKPLTPPPSGPGQENDTDRTIEMVGESDYEFVVKVAKKFNYDFFVLGGTVYFRKAKSDVTKQITLTPGARIVSLSVEYDMTGLVEEVEVRGLDVSKGKIVNSSVKNSNKLSMGNKAKSLLTGSKFVYVDPTVSAAADAEYRAKYLFEDMSYRYGTLEMTMVGLPDILPGRYLTIADLGDAVSNDFYVQSVRHTMSRDGEFLTHIVGKTDKQSSGGLI